MGHTVHCACNGLAVSGCGSQGGRGSRGRHGNSEPITAERHEGDQSAHCLFAVGIGADRPGHVVDRWGRRLNLAPSEPSARSVKDGPRCSSASVACAFCCPLIAAMAVGRVEPFPSMVSKFDSRQQSRSATLLEADLGVAGGMLLRWSLLKGRSSGYSLREALSRHAQQEAAILKSGWRLDRPKPNRCGSPRPVWCGVDQGPSSKRLSPP